MDVFAFGVELAHCAGFEKYRTVHDNTDLVGAHSNPVVKWVEKVSDELNLNIGNELLADNERDLYRLIARCIDDIPQNRPSMAEVVRALEKIGSII